MRAALFWVKPGLVLIKQPLPMKRGILATAHFHPCATNPHVSRATVDVGHRQPRHRSSKKTYYVCLLLLFFYVRVMGLCCVTSAALTREEFFPFVKLQHYS